MPPANPRRAYRYLAAAALIPGLALAGMLSPKDSITLWAANIAFYGLPQLAVLALVLPFKPRPAIVVGISWGMAAYLAAFGLWVFTRTHPDSMAWLGYLFTMPAACIGAGLALSIQHHEPHLRPLAATIVALCCVLLAITCGQAVVCNTLMDCRGVVRLAPAFNGQNPDKTSAPGKSKAAHRPLTPPKRDRPDDCYAAVAACHQRPPSSRCRPYCGHPWQSNQSLYWG